MMNPLQQFVLLSPVVHETTKYVLILDDFDSKLTAGLPTNGTVNLSGCSRPQPKTSSINLSTISRLTYESTTLKSE